jgi:glycosyltransferase involved in cell wall biosynthesis
LFLNWRDSSNPAAGGAETFTEEIGKRLVSQGNGVTIFTSSFEGCARETYRFGVRILRDGGKYSVYSRARAYLKRHEFEFDVVVDEINTVPFRAYNVVKARPVIAVIHQLAREVWFYETRFPINFLGRFLLEPLWLRGYRHIPTVTVSDSTRSDLLDLGFRRVHVVHNGIGMTPLEKPTPKESHPVMIFVGRLVKSKLPDHAIAAFKLVKKQLPDAELWMLGDGYLRAKFERTPTKGVRFFGRVSERDKFYLLRKAHVLLAPSVREGWGISIIEANAAGTPAVGYATRGLQDSIIDGITGSLVHPLDYKSLAEAAERVLREPQLAERFSRNALEWSKNFTWDSAAKEFYQFLESVSRLPMYF